MPRLSVSSSSMISIARTFGAPETVPAGKPAASASIASVPRGEPAFDVGDDVHDVAVALDDELLGHLDRADLGDAADIVAAEIEQHQMFGAFLRSARSSAASASSSACVLPRQRVPAIGRIVTLPSRTRTRISGLEQTI